MDGWLFGIDGGGTKSRIRVEAMGGAALHEGVAGSTNMASNPASAVSAQLRALLRGALASGLDPAACLAGYIGSAGVDRPADRGAMAVLLREAFAAEAEAAGKACRAAQAGPVVSVGNDAEPALVGALGDVEGFLLIAGTGSIAFGRARDGRTARAGGWGHLLGDEGSAFWVAFEAVKRGIRSGEGRDEPSGLLDAALAFFGLPDAPSLIPFAYKAFDKAAIARFAPTVARMAREGDRVAASIMEGAAVELAKLVASVREALSPFDGRRKLALMGGLVDNDETLRARVSSAVEAAAPDLDIVAAKGDASEGACMLARGSIG